MRMLMSVVCFLLLLATHIYGQSPAVFFRTDCTPHVSSQSCCWDTDNFTLSCGNGTSLVRIPSVTGTATPKALTRLTATGDIDASQLQIDPTTGNIALRAVPGSFGLYILDDEQPGVSADIMLEAYNAGTGGSQFLQRRARGTPLAPEKLQANDIVSANPVYAWARDAANTADAWVSIGQNRFAIESLDAESRVAGRYEVTLSSGVSASPLVKMRIAANGSVMMGNTVTGSPTAALDVFGNTIRVRTAKTPATATEACDAGTITWDTGYVYVCTATNSWKRAAITAW